MEIRCVCLTDRTSHKYRKIRFSMCFAELWQHTQALYAEMQCMSYQHVVAIAYYGLLLSDTGTMFVIF